MMTTADQNRFIKNIRSAMSRSSETAWIRKQKIFTSPGRNPEKRLDAIYSRTYAQRQELLDRLFKAALPIRLQVSVFPGIKAASDAVVKLVNDTSPEWGDNKSLVVWDHPLIERLELSRMLSDRQIPVHVTRPATDHTSDPAKRRDRKQIRENIILSYIGVTSADYCLADTATLVMKTRPGQARAVSLVPSIHIAVIELDRLIADLTELYTILSVDPYEKTEGLTNCMTLISGPSKTADIEATLVHGAHGPREVYLFIIDDAKETETGTSIFDV